MCSCTGPICFVVLSGLVGAGVVVMQAETTRMASPVSARPYLSASEAANMMAERVRIDDVALAPDASAIVYSVSRGSVAANRYNSEFLLQQLDGQGGVTGAPRVIERVAGMERPVSFTPEWFPDSRGLLYMAVPDGARNVGGTGTRKFMRYDVKTGHLASIPFFDPGPTGGERSRPRLTELPRYARCSPTGRFLSFIASIGEDQHLDPRAGVLANVQQRTRPGTSGTRHGLFVVEVANGAVTLVSPSTLHIVDYDWSPDENALVVSAAPDPDGLYILRTDLVVIDRVSRTARPLVTQEGRDTYPRWSPDGVWIAFDSQFGEPEYLLSGGMPALVPAAGGAVERIGALDVPTIARSGLVWQADSESFVYVSDHHLVSQPVTATVVTRRVTLNANEMNDSYSQITFSADRRWCAYIRESLTVPPDVFVQAWPGRTAQRITRFGDNFALTPRVRLDRVSWPSRDGLYNVHGMLLSPVDAWETKGATSRVNRPLPTLVFNPGGPAMFNAGFASDGMNGGPLPLAARGYAVLVPNTRGRGGYGREFTRGIRTGRSVHRLPAEDALAGVDFLVKRGIADANQLGVFGHSYGTGLTAQIITQTNRFRAAVLHEEASFDLLTSAHSAVPGSDWSLLFRDIGGRGQGTPGDHAEDARLMSETPLLNLHRVQTPTLIQWGSSEPNRIRGSADVLPGGLERAGVPTELRVYDEGHVFIRPAAIADDHTRIANWFDYWLRGVPYPDVARAKEYYEWQVARGLIPSRPK